MSWLLKRKQGQVAAPLEIKNALTDTIIVIITITITIDPVMVERTTRMDTGPSVDAETVTIKTVKGLDASVDVTGRQIKSLKKPS